MLSTPTDFISILRHQLENVSHRIFAMAPQLESTLDRLQNKTLYLDISGVNWAVLLQVKGRRLLFLDPVPDPPADVRVHASPFALMHMVMARSELNLMGGSEMSIQGDMQVAKHFLTLLQSLDIDWEEQLALRSNDIFARQSGLIVKSVQRWFQRSQASLSIALRDYLQEEVRQTPTQIEVENFAQDVDQLRTDVDRLEARLQRLLSEKNLCRT